MTTTTARILAASLTFPMLAAIAACDVPDAVVPTVSLAATSASALSMPVEPADIVDLGVPPGALSSTASALNDLEQVVGRVLVQESDGLAHSVPFVWSAATGMVPLLLPAPLNAASPVDINRAGVVVGNNNNLTVPFYWSSVTATAVTLAPLAGHGSARSVGVNADGTVTGVSQGVGNDRRAVLWSGPGTSAVEIIPGLSGTTAAAINAAGDVAGYIIPPLGLPVPAFVWSAGTLDNLGTFGADIAFARAMNDHGDLVADLVLSGSPGRGLVWDATTRTATTLSAADFPEPTNGIALRAINNGGEVLGVVSLPATPSQAFIWSAAAGIRLLPYPPSASSVNVADINNDGTVAGTATISGVAHAVVWRRVLPVVIDVRDDVNVNAANGVVQVVVFGTADFDAATIDGARVRFGAGAATPVQSVQLRDVNRDGAADAVFHFRMGASGIACGDTEVRLTGTTLTGRRFSGADAIRVLGCKRG